MDPVTMSMLIQGGASLLGGLFNRSRKPAEQAGQQFEKYYQQAKGIQQPFYQAGVNAVPQYQSWLGGMQNPSGFINNLMGGYQQSPWAQYQQQQSMRAAQNMGSAEGLTGSTPLMLQAQENARNISSQDMGTWLQNVLGINTMYGQGLGGLMNMGSGAANALTELAGTQGGRMGQAAQLQGMGRNFDFSNILGGLGSMAQGYFGNKAGNFGQYFNR